MPDPTTSAETDPAVPLGDQPKAHFAKAIDEVKAGAQLLGKQAQDRAEAYKDKLSQAADDLNANAKAKGDDAKLRAYQFAEDGKSRASGALSGLGRIVDDNATSVDERLGVHYGDYVRGVAQSIQQAADRLDAKELSELADEARSFVRANPALSVGIAAFGGYLISRMVGRVTA